MASRLRKNDNHKVPLPVAIPLRFLVKNPLPGWAKPFCHAYLYWIPSAHTFSSYARWEVPVSTLCEI